MVAGARSTSRANARSLGLVSLRPQRIGDYHQFTIIFFINIIIKIITNLIPNLTTIFLIIKTTPQVTYRLRERLDASPRPTSLGAPPSKAPTRLPAMGAPVGSIGKLASIFK